MKKQIFITCLATILLIGVRLFGQANPRWGSPLIIEPYPTQVDSVAKFRSTLIVSGGDVEELKIKGGVDNKAILTNTYPILKVGETRIVEFEWRVTKGSHEAFFKIESVKKGGDKSKKDNIVKQTFNQKSMAMSLAGMNPALFDKNASAQPECDTKPLPDLVVTDMGISGPGEARYDETYNIRVNYMNSGQCESGVFYVRLDVRREIPNAVQHNPDTTFTVNIKGATSLLPGQGSNVYFPFITEYIGQGDNTYYTFYATIDSDDRVSEFYEDNNEFDGPTLSILPKPRVN